MNAAVVGEEDDDGVVGELQLIERVEQAADVFVEALDHRAIDWISLWAAGR